MSEKKCCVWYNYCMLNYVYVQFIGAFLLVLGEKNYNLITASSRNTPRLLAKCIEAKVGRGRSLEY